ncbi:MAG: acyl-CoA thioesterase [Pseudomonadota bacterium]
MVDATLPLRKTPPNPKTRRMYPVLRTLLEARSAAKLPRLPIDGTHVSHHTCMPWDIDAYMELNNGRTLTLLDIGRTGLAIRTGLVGLLRANRWGLTMAGASVRYRRRIRPFNRFEVRSTALGYDARFMYLHQSIWRKGEAACSVLYRSAVVSKSGMVPTAEVLAALGEHDWRPTLPDWVQNWIQAEDTRPWPPAHP